MVQLCLTAYFKRQVLQWDGATVHMKDPSSFLGQSDITKRKMREVVIQTSETDYTRETTERMVKNLNSTYAKEDLKQVADNVTQLNAEERTLLLILLKDFEDLFDGNLVDWYTEPVYLKLSPYYKPFNSRYYPVPRINMETFRK